MKRIIIVMFIYIATTIFSFGQDTNPIPFDWTENKVVYTEIIELVNSREDLMRNFRTWIAEEVRKYKSEYIMDDPNSGRCIVELKDEKVTSTSGFSESFKVMVDCKENKYRYKIYDYIKIIVIAHPTKGISGGVEIVNTMESYRKEIDNAKEQSVISAGIDANNQLLRTAKSLKLKMAEKDNW